MFGMLDFAVMGDGHELLLRMIDQAFDRKSSLRAEGENARINLWLMDGQPPIDGKETEIIVSKLVCTVTRVDKR